MFSICCTVPMYICFHEYTVDNPSTKTGTIQGTGMCENITQRCSSQTPNVLYYQRLSRTVVRERTLVIGLLHLWEKTQMFRWYTILSNFSIQISTKQLQSPETLLTIVLKLDFLFSQLWLQQIYFYLCWLDKKKKIGPKFGGNDICSLIREVLHFRDDRLPGLITTLVIHPEIDSTLASCCLYHVKVILAALYVPSISGKQGTAMAS